MHERARYALLPKSQAAGGQAPPRPTRTAHHAHPLGDLLACACRGSPHAGRSDLAQRCDVEVDALGVARHEVLADDLRRVGHKRLGLC